MNHANPRKTGIRSNLEENQLARKNPGGKKQSRKWKRGVFGVTGMLLAAGLVGRGHSLAGNVDPTGKLPFADGGGRNPAWKVAAAASSLKGKKVYEEHCQKCHGPNVRGSEKGPSFLNPIYRPKLHSDVAFLLAVKRGVRQHHWTFGHMPPVRGVDEKDISRIIRYVRDLQRKEGIF